MLVLNQYEKYLDERLQKDPNFKNILLTHKDKNLGCWCVTATRPPIYDYKNISDEDFKKYGLCHGDVIHKKIKDILDTDKFILGVVDEKKINNRGRKK